MANATSGKRSNVSPLTPRSAPVVAGGSPPVLTAVAKRLTPVEIARIALGRIQENALAPTPENFVCEYRRAAGPAAGAAATSHPLDQAAPTVEMVRAIIQVVTDATAGFAAAGLELFDCQSKRAQQVADAAREADELAQLLRTVTGSAMSMIQVIKSSQPELNQSRRTLERLNAELEQTQTLARTDSLTGFCNRRAMEELITREIARARRAKAPFSLAILDIDHFKEVNDQYGHAVGDQALIHVARLVKARLRETDEICRYGGEEFVVTLPGADAAGALLVLDRMRVAVEATPLECGHGRIVLRFSAGVAQAVPPETKELLLQRADSALYKAKQCGRNRVEVADGNEAA